MRQFSYKQAADEKAAVAAVVSKTQTAYLAGGTTLIDLMKLNVQTPATLVDITSIPLTKIETHDSGVRIGAMASNSDVAHNPIIR